MRTSGEIQREFNELKEYKEKVMNQFKKLGVTQEEIDKCFDLAWDMNRTEGEESVEDFLDVLYNIMKAQLNPATKTIFNKPYPPVLDMV